MKKTNKLLPAKSVEKKALGGIIAATATNVIPGLIGGIFNNIAKRRAELRAEKDLMEQQILNSQPEQFRKGGRIYEYPGGGYTQFANNAFPEEGSSEILGYDEKGKPVYVGYEYPSVKPENSLKGNSPKYTTAKSTLINKVTEGANLSKTPLKPTGQTSKSQVKPKSYYSDMEELGILTRKTDHNDYLPPEEHNRFLQLMRQYPKEYQQISDVTGTGDAYSDEFTPQNKDGLTYQEKFSNLDYDERDLISLNYLLREYLTRGLNQSQLQKFYQLKKSYPVEYEKIESEQSLEQLKMLTRAQKDGELAWKDRTTFNELRSSYPKEHRQYEHEFDVNKLNSLHRKAQKKGLSPKEFEDYKNLQRFLPKDYEQIDKEFKIENRHQYAIGGYVNSPIQAEEFQGQKETIALPNDQLIETNAEAPHEQMPDQQITDVLPENSYVFSARNKLSAKTAMQLLLELGMDKKDVNKLKGKKEISPVDVSNLAKPTKNTANDYQTSELKERNRQAVLEKAKTFNELLKVLNPEEQPQMAGGGSLLNPNTYSPFAIPQIAMPTFNPNLNTTFTGKDYFTQRTPQISPFANYQVPDVSLNYQNTPNSYNPFATAKMDLKTGIFPKPTTNYFGGSPYADSIAEKRANADLEAYESSLLNDSTAMAERDLAWKRAQLDSASGFKGNSEKPFMKIPENRSNQNKMFSDKDLTLFAGNMAANLVSGLGTLSQQMYRTIPTNYAPIMNMNTEPEYKSAINSLLQSQKMATDSILNNSYNPLLGMANATNAAANTQSSIAQYMGQVANQRQQLQNQKLTALQSLLAGEQGINQNIEKERAALSNLKKTYPGELAKHTARDISNYVLDKDKKQAQMNQDRAILEMMMKLYNNPAITDLLDKAKNTVWGNK